MDVYDDLQQTAKLNTTKAPTMALNTSDAQVSKPTSKHRSKPIRRTRSFNAICYLSDEESVTATNFVEFGDSVEAATTKKPKTRKRKCGGEISGISGTINKKQHTAHDAAQPARQFATTSTQTDISGDYLSSTQMQSSESESQPATTPSATVNSDVNAIQNEIHDIITTLIVQHDDINEIREALKQISSRQTELNDVHNEVKHLAAQFTSWSASFNASGGHRQRTQHSISQYNVSPVNNQPYEDADFPPLPQPTGPIIQQNVQTHNTRSTSSENSQPKHQRSQSSHDQLKNDVMAAMYVDLKSKERRANNVIISGLTQQRDISDEISVCNLLHDEFECDVADDIKSCKRIGKPQQNRAQLILVTFKTAENAAYFTANAKTLRKSRHQEVREKSLSLRILLLPSQKRHLKSDADAENNMRSRETRLLTAVHQHRNTQLRLDVCSTTPNRSGNQQHLQLQVWNRNSNGERRRQTMETTTNMNYCTL